MPLLAANDMMNDHCVFASPAASLTVSFHPFTSFTSFISFISFFSLISFISFIHIHYSSHLHHSFPLRIFIGFQWTIFGLQSFIDFMIPDEATKVTVQKQRQEFLREKV